MSRLNSLTKLANRFYFQALAAQNAQLEQYFVRMIREMIGLARGAEVSVKHMLSLPKYSKSSGLQEMVQTIPQLTTSIIGISPADPQSSLNDVEGVLNSLSFYTSPNNSGTGYDPATRISEGGYSAPSYYIDTLTKMVGQMKSKVPNNTQTPQNVA